MAYHCNCECDNWIDENSDDDSSACSSDAAPKQRTYSSTLLVSPDAQQHDKWEWTSAHTEDDNVEPSQRVRVVVPNTCPSQWRDIFATCQVEARELRDRLTRELGIQLGLTRTYAHNVAVRREERIDYGDESYDMHLVAAAYVFINYGDQVKVPARSGLMIENAIGLVVLAAMASNLLSFDSADELRQYMRSNVLVDWVELQRFRIKRWANPQ